MLIKERIEELKTMFEAEKERILVFLIKNKGYGSLIKKLKKMADKYRDALLQRYFLKCRIVHNDKFFEWR